MSRSTSDPSLPLSAVEENRPGPERHLREALDHLSAAFGCVDAAVRDLQAPEHGAALQVRDELVEIQRRVRNLALFRGADPAQLEDSRRAGGGS